MLPNIRLTGREISFYGILAVAGILAAGFFACRQAKKRGKSADAMILLLLFAAIGVLAGSHLLFFLINLRGLEAARLYLAQNSGLKALGEVLAFLFGGSVFYGGLLGGLAAGGLYLRRLGRDAPLYADVCGAAIPLFHAFGRVGCFLGGCCYGVESPWGFVSHHSPYPQANGVSRVPVQLLEALFELALFLLLWHLLRRGRLPGRLLPLYLTIYPVGRFLLEYLRGDVSRGVWGPFSTSQWISLGLFPAACCLLLLKKSPSGAKNKSYNID